MKAAASISVRLIVSFDIRPSVDTYYRFPAEYAIEMAGVHLRSMDQMYWRENKPSLEENMASLEVHMQATKEAMSTLPAITLKGDTVNPHVLTLQSVITAQHSRLSR